MTTRRDLIETRVTILYDIVYVDLSETYDTLPDIDNPDRVEADTFISTLEGEYDYVFLGYDAEKEACSNSSLPVPIRENSLYVMDDDGVLT